MPVVMAVVIRVATLQQVTDLSECVKRSWQKLVTLVVMPIL